MTKIDPQAFEPLPDRHFETKAGQALLDRLTEARPWRYGWRLPFWWYLGFFRRGLLSFHTIAYVGLAFRDPWTLLTVGLAVIAFELRLVPGAMDLRLHDSEFIKLVLTGQRIEPAGNGAEIRRAWRRFAGVWVSGAVMAIPLWWLARLDASGLCPESQAADITCRLAEPGMVAFKAWFGLLTLGPFAYASLRFPLPLPGRCPSRASEPALYSWTTEGYGRELPGLPRIVLVYLFPLVSSVCFVMFAAALGNNTGSMLNPVVLLGAAAMGGFHALLTLQFRPEFKGWSIVRAYLETEISHRRNPAQGD